MSEANETGMLDLPVERIVMPEPCSVCGAPSTHAKRNLYSVTNKDGTYSFAPAGPQLGCTGVVLRLFWRHDD